MKSVAILMLAAGMAFAQRGGGGGGGGMGGGRGGSMGNQGMYQQMSHSRLDIFSQALQLNKDQKKDVKTTLDDAQKEAAPLRDQISQARQEIADAIQAGKNSDEINKAVNGCAALQSQMAAIEMKALAKIFKLLDADQQKKVPLVFQMMSGIFMGKNWNVIE